MIILSRLGGFFGVVFGVRFLRQKTGFKRFSLGLFVSKRLKNRELAWSDPDAGLAFPSVDAQLEAWAALPPVRLGCE